MASWRRTSVGMVVALAAVPVAGAGGLAGSTGAGAVPATGVPAVAEAPMVPGGPLPGVIGPQATSGPGFERTSSNWSGYVVKASSAFTGAEGSWVEPAATCTSTDTMAGFWVGIDGYGTSTVEQTGTAVECTGGTPRYFAWWEMYPGASQVIAHPVAPGDTLTARVLRSGTSYRLVLVSSAGWRFSTTQISATATDASAEWIAEAPSGGTGIYPLADYGKVRFTRAQAADGGAFAPLSSFTADSGPIEVAMTQGGKVVSQPSPLFSSGKGFAIRFE
ncbi:MAG: G1 family glutamic endopeptidase [Acidimicrobiales bacterium]